MIIPAPNTPPINEPITPNIIEYLQASPKAKIEFLIVLTNSAPLVT